MSEKIEVSDKQVKPEKKVSVKETKSWVLLRLTYPVIYRYKSPTTGNEYVWKRAGSNLPVVSVHPDDAPVLLSKTRKGGCCGASPQINFIFEEVK